MIIIVKTKKHLLFESISFMTSLFQSFASSLSFWKAAFSWTNMCPLETFTPSGHLFIWCWISNLWSWEERLWFRVMVSWKEKYISFCTSLFSVSRSLTFFFFFNDSTYKLIIYSIFLSYPAYLRMIPSRSMLSQ